MPPERRNEIVSFVKGGLQDLSVSRTTFDWGIPVPDKPGHIIYVWVDALTNYISGAGFPNVRSKRYKTYWPADMHIIGKDILRFHAVYWPAFLMSAKLPLPRHVFAHGMLLTRGVKMSKSEGNVVDPFGLVDLYGADQFRYFCLREVPFGQDGNFSHEAMVNRTNADLANDLGNLAQRSLTMIVKNCGGVVPEPGAYTDVDKAMLSAADVLLEVAREAMEKQAVHKVLEAVWQVVGIANRYFAGQEPWALKKTDPARMGTVLYITAEVLREVAILAQMVVPEGAARLLDQLGVSGPRDFSTLGEGGRLTPGSPIGKPEPVFPRFVEQDNEESAA
jgi:methionyl-tRNA synthetase